MTNDGKTLLIAYLVDAGDIDPDGDVGAQSPISAYVSRHWPPGGGRRRRFGSGRGGCVVASIGCSWFGVGFVFPKPLSQKHRSTFLPLQDANPTPSFGGFGLRGILRCVSKARCRSCRVRLLGSCNSMGRYRVVHR